MNLKHYIFLSDEGYTYQNNSNFILADIENLQVIGFCSGVDAEDAFKSLLVENIYLKDTNFDNIFCYKLDDNYEHSRKDFVISDLDK